MNIRIPEFVQASYVAANCFTGNWERQRSLLAELSRIGLNEVNVHWSFPTPYRELLLHNIPHISFMDRHPGCWGATLNHYKILKTAYELGYESVFVVEDDCRFLKEKDKIWETLEKAPKQWDILLLDNFTRRGKISSAGGGWFTCDSAESTGCYIANRRGMAALVGLYEKPAFGKGNGGVLRNSDHWTARKYLGDKARFFIAIPNLAVQKPMGDSSNCGSYVFDEYKKMHIDIRNYA